MDAGGLPNVLPFLDRHSLCLLSRCSRAMRELVNPILFAAVHIQLSQKGIDKRSGLLMRTLVTRESLRRHIRTITVTSRTSQRLSKDVALTLASFLRPLLMSAPNIQTYRSTIPHPFTGCVIRSLRELRCEQITEANELEWVRWHLLNCRLTRLSLSFADDLLGRRVATLLNTADAYDLEHLAISHADVSLLKVARLPGLVSLSIDSCSGVDALVRRLW